MRYNFEGLFWQLRYIIITKISVKLKCCTWDINWIQRGKYAIALMQNTLTHSLIKLFGKSVGVSFKPIERHDKVSCSTVPLHWQPRFSHAEHSCRVVYTFSSYCFIALSYISSASCCEFDESITTDSNEERLFAFEFFVVGFRAGVEAWCWPVVVSDVVGNDFIDCPNGWSIVSILNPFETVDIGTVTVTGSIVVGWTAIRTPTSTLMVSRTNSPLTHAMQIPVNVPYTTDWFVSSAVESLEFNLLKL